MQIVSGPTSPRWPGPRDPVPAPAGLVLLASAAPFALLLPTDTRSLSRTTATGPNATEPSGDSEESPVFEVCPPELLKGVGIPRCRSWRTFQDAGATTTTCSTTAGAGPRAGAGPWAVPARRSARVAGVHRPRIGHAGGGRTTDGLPRYNEMWRRSCEKENVPFSPLVRDTPAGFNVVRDR